MKLIFTLNNNDAGAFTFTAEGPTILQALAAVERELILSTCPEAALCDESHSGFDIAECVECLQSGEVYNRLDFSTPEENFSIAEVTD